MLNRHSPTTGMQAQGYHSQQPVHHAQAILNA